MRHPLHALCPYFAMFPEDFARSRITEYTVPGDLVLDPFSGRGTTLLEALLLGRSAAATDVNPVAYCVTGAKAEAPTLPEVSERLSALEDDFVGHPHEELQAQRLGLSSFFRSAFYWATLHQLLYLRRALRWRKDSCDRFIAALCLGSLHGERDKRTKYFSNQMPRTISTKPEYSVRYWRANRLRPHKRDVFAILRERAMYRLAGERPALTGRVALADARDAARVFPDIRGQAKVVVTSPPYYDVTNFEEDQWLRLWFLGYSPRPTYGSISRDDRHVRKAAYWKFLAEAWQGISPLVAGDAVLVCRLGGRGLGVGELKRGLLQSLTHAFPGARLVRAPQQSPIHNRQTRSFRPGSTGCRYEWDFVLELGAPGAG
ncbi:MAG: DNA methylase [Armatimonadetes bacterium]|nr:DNA methylase [Armatimonadota bacterium]